MRLKIQTEALRGWEPVDNLQPEIKSQHPGPVAQCVHCQKSNGQEGRERLQSAPHTWLSYAPWSVSSQKEQLKTACLHQLKGKTEPYKPGMEQHFKKRTKTTELFLPRKIDTPFREEVSQSIFIDGILWIVRIYKIKKKFFQD